MESKDEIIEAQVRLKSYWLTWRQNLESWAAAKPTVPICLVGAGIIGAYATSCLPVESVGFFIDSNPHKQAKGWQGVKVLSPRSHLPQERGSRFAVTLHPRLAAEVGPVLVGSATSGDVWFPPAYPLGVVEAGDGDLS